MISSYSYGCCFLPKCNKHVFFLLLNVIQISYFLTEIEGKNFEISCFVEIYVMHRLLLQYFWLNVGFSSISYLAFTREMFCKH